LIKQKGFIAVLIITILLIGIIAAPVLAETEMQWEKKSGSVADALAYHEGLLAASYPSGTWFYDGADWERITTSVAVALAFDNNGQLWASYPSGTWSYDPNTNDWVSLTSATAKALALDSEGKMWASFNSGTFSYTGTAWNQLTGSRADALAFDVTGNLWASYPSGTWSYDGNNWDKITSSVAIALAFNNGTLWASYSSGTWLYDGASWGTEPLTGSTAKAMVFDAADALWASFPSGTWVYSAVPEEEVDVTVKVEDTEGAALEGAIVTLNGLEETSDSDGEVLFKDVLEGDYKIIASKKGYFDVDKEATVTKDDNEFTVVLEERDDVVVELVDDEIAAGTDLSINMINYSTSAVELDDEANYRFRMRNENDEEWNTWSSRRVVTPLDNNIVAAQSEEVLFSTSEPFSELGQYQIQVELYKDDALEYDETFNFIVLLAGVNPTASSVTADPTTVTVGNASEVTVELVDMEENVYSGLAEEDFEITFAGDGEDGAFVVSNSFEEDPAEPGTYTFEVNNEKAETVTVTVKAAQVELADKPEITFNPATATALYVAGPEEYAATTAGTAIAPTTVITVDQYGNPSTEGLVGSQSVIAAIKSGPEGADLSGDKDKNIGTAGGNGELVFDDLTLDKEGTYVLEFTSSGFAAAESAEILVTGAYHTYKFDIVPETVEVDSTTTLISEPPVGNDPAELQNASTLEMSIIIDEEKDKAYEGKVRVAAPEYETDKLQLWAQDSEGNWYNINVTGWGPAGGFEIEPGEPTTVYVLTTLSADTYNISLTLDDLDGNYAEGDPVIEDQVIEFAVVDPPA